MDGMDEHRGTEDTERGDALQELREAYMALCSVHDDFIELVMKRTTEVVVGLTRLLEGSALLLRQRRDGRL
jgi:hypothetical protein